VSIINTDATGQTPLPLTQDSLVVWRRRWSPDGTKIAYVRHYPA
jgi:Tol biopolymer transport system component